MMVVMKAGATEEQIQHVVERLEKAGLGAHLSRGEFKTVIGVIGDREKIANVALEATPGVENVISIQKPYKFVSREFRSEDTVLDIKGSKIGGRHFAVIAGPCSVETEEQMNLAAESVKKAGASFLRGGAFKPRTSPYSFQGLGESGLKLLSNAGKRVGLPIVTELLDVRDIDVVAEYADVIQIGTRNMQNFVLLLEAGRTGKPVILKRGFGSTVEETLMAAEYIVKGGSSQIILCERGIRTFENATRNTLDLSMIPIAKKNSHLPVIVDPSHGTGKNYLVAPMSLAALAAGADGVMVEVHPNPEEAWCDGPQSLNLDAFSDLMAKIKPIAAVLDRQIQ
jgi:3-deoxy-7-phosphoheptulonate synthase